MPSTRPFRPDRHATPRPGRIAELANRLYTQLCERDQNALNLRMTNGDPSVQELTGCACLRLRKVTRRVTQIYDQALEPVGLTCTQFSLLGYVVSARSLSIGQLAARLVMDPTTLTRVLKPLEREGHVRVVADRGDRRRRMVEPTPSGRAAFEDAVPLWRQAKGRLVDLFGDDDFRSLQAMLATALEHLASPS